MRASRWAGAGAMAMAMAMGSAPALAADEGPSWSLVRVSISRVYYVDAASIRRQGEETIGRVLVSYAGRDADGFKSMSFTARVKCEKELFSAVDFVGSAEAMGEGAASAMAHRVEERSYGESSPIWSVAGLMCVKGASAP